MPTEAIVAKHARPQQAIAAALQEGRERTHQLMRGLPESTWAEARCPYLSPPVWDLGHIANFEEKWLVQHAGERAESRPGCNDIYDAARHPRPTRPRLELMGPNEVKRYLHAVRQATLDVLDCIDIGPEATPTLRDGFVHWMLVNHEQQHQETLLQTMQMSHAQYTPDGVRALPEPGPVEPEWILVPGGPFWMGRDQVPGVYDNEAPGHDVDVPAFQIARYPVTCGDYLRFLEDGGYDDRSHWSSRGREWLDDVEHHAPMYWRKTADGWMRDSVGGVAPVADVQDEILCHVTFWEAEAYASWSGARLPTETEWEKACRYDPTTGASRLNPWGDDMATTERANVDQLAFAPSRIGAYPDGATPLGVQHMIGDVWEWTDSGFEPYPGFEAFPYRDYSEAFWGGDFRVLRGGSWATRWGCAHGAFRNWDHPYRRQIFAGLRLARDP